MNDLRVGRRIVKGIIANKDIEVNVRQRFMNGVFFFSASYLKDPNKLLSVLLMRTESNKTGAKNIAEKLAK